MTKIESIATELAEAEALALETFIKVRINSIPSSCLSKIVLQRTSYLIDTKYITEWRVLLDKGGDAE